MALLNSMSIQLEGFSAIRDMYEKDEYFGKILGCVRKGIKKIMYSKMVFSFEEPIRAFQNSP